MRPTFEKISTILIWSEDYKRLANWYKETFGFNVIEELNHPQDTGVLFDTGMGSPWVWIGQHSEIKGMNPDPDRHMFNINVSSVTETYDYLKQIGVQIIAEPFKAPTFDKYFATFSDPDGNIIQIIGGK